MSKSVFDIPIQNMPRVKSNDAILARDFNTHSEAIERIQKGVAPAQQILPDRVLEAVAGSDVQLFQISGTPTLVSLPCNQLTGADAGSTVSVAKPHDLRGVASPGTNGYFVNGVFWRCSSYQQAGNRRTATNTLVTETQVITKTYEDGDFIVAVKVGEDVTQVSGLEWYDLNVMGRNWARAFGT